MKTNRRNFLKTMSAGITFSPLLSFSGEPEIKETSAENNDKNQEETGYQRLTLKQLKQWETLKYGMFIHFGMSTFDGDELSKGDKPSEFYNPQKLDVNQWIKVAGDAGMKYAILTTKHVSGHCLWPSRQTDYHVGTSGNTTDVVEQFVNACARYNILPGFYYCSWDNHHLFGSGTPTFVGWDKKFTTREYRDFQLRQVEELLTGYGKIAEMWIDIPGILGEQGRQEQYDQIVSLQPDAVIMMNSGFGDGTQLKKDYAWPTDIMAIERYLPNSNKGYNPWFWIDGKKYYIPGEVCDPIGYEWFFREDDHLRSDEELLGMRLICQARGANLLLDVPPDKTGKIPEKTVKSLIRLANGFAKVSRV